MTWYTPPSVGVLALIAEVIDEYYPDLVETKARIGAVFAHADPDSDKPPMLKNGLQILAKIKKNSEADRIDGKPDATITFDASHWQSMLDDDFDGRDKAKALIDHELYHLICKRDKETGRFSTDDQGRPKFDIRPHDWEITGFRAVAERHGKAAAEVIEARRFHDTFGNLLFHFAGEHAVDRQATFVEQVMDEVAEEINAGALGPDVTVNGRKPRSKAKASAVVSAANR